MCCTNSVHGPYPSLKCSFPGHREVACPRDRSEENSSAFVCAKAFGVNRPQDQDANPPRPIPTYGYQFLLAFPFYVNEKTTWMTWMTWLSFQLTFLEVGFDDDVRQFAGWMTFLSVFGIVGFRFRHMDRNAGCPDPKAGHNNFGWVNWLFGGGNEGNEALEDALADEVDDSYTFKAIIILVIIIFLIKADAFIKVSLSFLGFIFGNPILASLPVATRVVLFLCALKYTIADSFAHCLRSYISNYVRKRVVMLFTGAPTGPPASTFAVHDLITYWMIQTHVIATELVHLLPQQLLEFLPMGFLAPVIRVFVAYYLLAALLRLFMVRFFSLSSS